MSSHLRRALFALAVLPFLGFPLTELNAGTIAVTWENVGSNLKATWTGTFSTTGYSSGSLLNGDGTAGSYGSIAPPSPTSGFGMYSSEVGTANMQTYRRAGQSHLGSDVFHFSTGDTTIRSGISFELGTNSGSNPDTAFSASTGWSSGESISGSATWTGKTLASVFGSNLPLYATKTMFDDGANTVTFQAVPEPSTWLLAFGGLAYAGQRKLRRFLRVR
jgi:hypothetical protein